MSTQATIVDPEQAYPPSQVVIDRPTDNLFDFVAACEELRRRALDAHQAQVDHACMTLGRQLATQGRQVSKAVLREAARWQVAYERRYTTDQELRGMHPSSQLLHDADAHDDTELYRRREQALALLVSSDADSYVHLVPEVLADRENACQQQAVLVDDQEQLNRQLGQLRGVRGLISLRRVRQLNAELGELDRQLIEVQGQIRHQQALLDAISAADDNRQEWLAEHQATLHQGAVAVIVLTRRFLALANPPGCPQPVLEVHLDHPMGRDPLPPPSPIPATPPSGPATPVRVTATSAAPSGRR